MFLQLTDTLWVNTDYIISIEQGFEDPEADVVLASSGDFDAPNKVRVLYPFWGTLQDWLRLNEHHKVSPVS